MNSTEDIVILWEAPKILPPEFRLYYDEAGKVICYTCEKLAGNFITIDSVTFAQSRPDVRVIDGHISTVSANAIISKLMPSSEGQSCATEDVSIVVDESYQGSITKWKLTTYEL